MCCLTGTELYSIPSRRMPNAYRHMFAALGMSWSILKLKRHLIRRLGIACTAPRICTFCSRWEEDRRTLEAVLQKNKRRRCSQGQGPCCERSVGDSRWRWYRKREPLRACGGSFREHNVSARNYFLRRICSEDCTTTKTASRAPANSSQKTPGAAPILRIYRRRPRGY